MKTRLSLSIVIILTNLFVQAQSPNWQWAKKGGGVSSDEGRSITTDLNDNVYVTGAFHGASITFGSTTLTNFTSGSADVFVVKYDQLGNVVWAKKGTGNDNDQGYGIVADQLGNVYVTGSFSSTTITFGTSVLTNNSTANLNDFFVVKYDPSGNVLWAKNGGGTGSDNGFGIALDAVGRPYVTGNFSSPSFNFGSDNLVNSNTNTSDFFILRYDSVGNPNWAKGVGDVGGEEGRAISAGPFGAMYVTGFFQSDTVMFGDSTIANTDVTGTTYDAFVVKYDTTGAFVHWAKKIGGTDYDIGNGVSADASDNVYVIGNFASATVVVGTTTLVNNTIPYNDIFIVKFDVNSNPAWAKSTGGNENEEGISIIADAIGNTYLTGYFGSASIVFGNDTLLNADAFNTTRDIYVAKYNSAGNALWGKSAGGIDNDYGWGISLGSGGNATATGWFASLSIGFGTTTLTNTSSGSNADVFTARLGSCASSAPNICMVTVDSLSHYNIIVWDKTSFTNVDSFIVYREITTNNYQRLGAVPYSALSQFVDTVRTLYFPNTGDPNGGTYRYKLQSHDSCGVYSALGPYHNTIYMTNNNGTFSWPQLYTIESSSNPVNAYVLMRDDNNTGSWHAVNSVAGTQQSVTDPAYSSFVATANWRVQTLWSISCTPTLKYSNNVQSAFSSSHSNLLHTLTSVNELSINNLLNIFPNPSAGKFNIDLSDAETKISNVEIYNAIGQKVFQENYSQTISSSGIDISSSPNGIYFVCVQTTKGTARKKIIVQK